MDGRERHLPEDKSPLTQEDLMGLNEEVERAVNEVMDLVESVVHRVLAGNWPGETQTN